MPFIDIHGKKVHIEDDSHSAHIAADFLKKHPDNAKAFFNEAQKDRVNGVAHFDMTPSAEHPNVGHHFTLIHNSDGTYNLRKKHSY